MADTATAIFPLEVRRMDVWLGGHQALRDLTFTLDGSRRTVVLGANGAGKSVLLRALHGLLQIDAGEIRWNGSMKRPPEQGMVFQRPVMLRRSAFENVVYGLRAAGVSRDESEIRADEAITQVGLTHVQQRQARVLSGGEQQRIALARAWALRPRVLFLDEPTASLDPAAAADIERIIGAIHASGTKIVMTTHNLGLARRIADEILFLHEGCLAEQAPSDRFFSAPRSRDADAFLKGELP